MDSEGDGRMFTYILWGLIVLVLVLVAKRLFQGAILLVVYVLLIFFAVFLLDTVTPFPLRSIITLQWYDDAIEDPGKAIKDTVEVAKDTSGKAVDKVNEAGGNLDVHYGTETDKEWSRVGESKEERLLEDVRQKEGSSFKNDGKEDKLSLIEEDDVEKSDLDIEGDYFIPYKDVNKVVNEKFSQLTEGDKEIIKAMTSVYSTRIQGEDVEVWNTGDKRDEGIYVKYKGD